MKGREDFLLINLCIDSKEDKWKELVARHRMQGINLFAAGNWSEKIKNAYQVQGIPQYMLLSKGNRLVENYTNGPATIDELLLQQLEAPQIKEAINHPVQ